MARHLLMFAALAALTSGCLRHHDDCACPVYKGTAQTLAETAAHDPGTPEDGSTVVTMQYDEASRAVFPRGWSECR